MIHRMFESLGISSSRDPAPPLVNNPRHQPKPSRASTVRNLPRPARSPTRSPYDSELEDRDPASSVGHPATTTGYATELGRAAHRSLTKRGVLPKALADTIGERLYQQTALTTTAAGPQSFVVLGVKTLVGSPPSTDHRLPHDVELELMRTKTQLIDGSKDALVHAIDSNDDRPLQAIVDEMLRCIYKSPLSGVNKACVTVEHTLACLTWDSPAVSTTTVGAVTVHLVTFPINSMDHQDLSAKVCFHDKKSTNYVHTLFST